MAGYLGNDELTALERLVAVVDPGPWKAMVEGRDHDSGDDFIMVGPPGDRGEDVYITRDSRPADPATLDYIAAACSFLSALIAEVRRLRAAVRNRSIPSMASASAASADLRAAGSLQECGATTQVRLRRGGQ